MLLKENMKFKSVRVSLIIVLMYQEWRSCNPLGHDPKGERMALSTAR